MTGTILLLDWIIEENYEIPGLGFLYIAKQERSRKKISLR